MNIISYLPCVILIRGCVCSIGKLVYIIQQILIGQAAMSRRVPISTVHVLLNKTYFVTSIIYLIKVMMVKSYYREQRDG